MTDDLRHTQAERAQRAARVQDAAKGRWALIFEDLAPQLHAALAQAPMHVACPVHGGSDGFRLFPHFNDSGQGICNTCGGRTTGVSLLAWAKQIPPAQAQQEVEAWLKLEQNKGRTVKRRSAWQMPVRDPAAALRSLERVWHESGPIAGTPAETYLVKRGIWRCNLASVLRHHPGLPYFEGKERRKLGVYPCLLAPVRSPDGRLATLHRTFITPEGDKAPVPSPKKLMPARCDLHGAAIRLFPAQEELGVAEGVETALAAHAVSRMPVWACVSATLLEQVEVPSNVRKLVIWADLDRSERGGQAAEKLADRMERAGKRVQIHLPQGPLPAQSKGVDWLDILNTQGLNGFPAQFRRWRPPSALAA
jgi:phage/plasmid primase-like uncharacterized protein